MKETRQLIDYLHFYIGCDILIGNEKSKMDVTELSALYVLSKTHKLEDNIKIILRDLSGIMEDEFHEYNRLKSKVEINHNGTIKWEEDTPESFRYLLSKHFDIFGLMKDGLEIDKAKIPVQ